MPGIGRGIDEIIRKAIEEGAFDNLPGEGKPLDLRENPFVEPEWRMAYRLLAQEGFALPWMEKRNQIEQELAAARANLSRTWVWYHEKAEAGELNWSVERDWQQAVSRFTDRAADLNKRINAYNLEIPADVFYRRLVDAEGEIEEIKKA